MNNRHLSKEAEKPDLSYFGLQAYWGATKHMGGVKATRELAELCRLNKDKHVLDVGCGVGRTSCYLAERYGCRVTGIDISEKMVGRAKERAREGEIEDKAEFKVADMQDLPFGDTFFDSVIGESVIAFVEEKEEAVSECERVMKPGGYVGFNECTWIKSPPTDFVEYYSHATGVKEILTSGGWEELLKDSGLKNVEARTYEISALSQFLNEIGVIGIKDYLRGWYKFLSLALSSPDFREYLKELWPSSEIIKNFSKYLGYGLYVGRKQEK